MASWGTVTFTGCLPKFNPSRPHSTRTQGLTLSAAVRVDPNGPKTTTGSHHSSHGVRFTEEHTDLPEQAGQRTGLLGASSLSSARRELRSVKTVVGNRLTAMS